MLLELVFAQPALAFTYDDLVALIQSERITRVEEVLPKLPAGMRANFTLMQDTRSLQAASPAAPRAILLTPDGRLTCSFNGSTAQSGGDTLECIQFRDGERAFDFRQIQFPTAENGNKAVEFSERGKTANGVISCAACHGADPRPNWDAYNQWKGAFGENDDHPDQAPFKLFRDGADANPRYQWLVREHNTYAPYRLNEVDFEILHRPNLRISETYGRLNALRAARILGERLPEWERWAYAATALHCAISDSQRALLDRYGVTKEKLEMNALFRDVRLPWYEWSTQISADGPSYPDKHWEHQPGLSMYTELVASAFLQNEARSGNTTLANGLEAIKKYYLVAYSGSDLEVRRALNELVPSPDFFGQGYQENLNELCPETVRKLVEVSGKRAY